MAARESRPARERARRAGAAGAVPAAAALPAPARAIAIATGATLALRVIAALLPGRWLWGADLGRDLAPLAFVAPLALAAALLAPALARPLARALPEGATGATLLGGALALAMGALALAFPDRLQFTGDSGMRHGTFAASEHPLLLVPQAMPGDLWLHWALPRWMLAHAHWSAEATDRALGALLAVANGMAAARLARALRLTGAPALAVMAIAGWTAAPALFSGYAKALVELAVLELVAAAALAGVARGREGLTVLGLATAAAIVLHRSGLVLLPAYLAGAALVIRREGANAWRRPALAISALPVAAALAALGPRLARTLAGFDVSHHVARAGASPAAIGGYVLAPAHLLDLANLLLLLVPALPLAFAFVVRERGDGDADGRAARAFATAALVLPPLAVALVVRPQQGVFRDWDMFMPAGVAVAAWLATRTGERLARARDGAHLALPVLVLCVAVSAGWLAHQADVPRATARARAILLGPPARSGDERATGFDRLALVALWANDADAMAEACSLSVDAAPNPRVLGEWGMAETMRQRYAAAQAHYLRAVALNPDFTLAWKGVAASSSALGDRDHMADAVRALMRLEPRGETLREAALWLERNRPATSAR